MTDHAATVAALRTAIVTASNDDTSAPDTPERSRHVARLKAMEDAADALSRPVVTEVGPAMLDPFRPAQDGWATTGVRARADAPRDPTPPSGGSGLAPQPTYPGHDPAGGAVTLAECPVGLFVPVSRPESPCLKTEYSNNDGRITAYIVSTGEFFWGEAPQTIANQRKQMVIPIDLTEREASIRAEATAKERGRCAGDAFKAALFSYLFNQCAYSYGGSSASEPSPAEFGISWSWQQSKPGVPRMIDQLAEDALQYFERYINEMDPGDEPTDWDREVMRHAAAIRGGGND